MSFIPEGDTITKGFWSPKKMAKKTAYKLRVIDYKREQGGKFPDKDGYTTIYVFEPKDDKLNDYLDEDGLVKFTCGSKRLRLAFFEEDVNIGDTITLTQSGEGFDTTYKMVKLETAKVETEDIDVEK